MNIVLWIVQGLLALGFLAAGGPKLLQPIPVVAKRLSWAAELPAWQVRGIGLAEILGALGLILPGVTGIAPVLTVAAAAGLVVVMVSAIVFHLVRHDDPSRIIPSLALGLLALVIIYGRLALAPLA